MSDEATTSAVDKPVTTAQKRPAEHDGDLTNANGEQAAKRARQPESASEFASLTKAQCASTADPGVQSDASSNSNVYPGAGSSSFLKPSALALQTKRIRDSPVLDSPSGTVSPSTATPTSRFEHDDPGSPNVRSFCLAPSTLSAPNSTASSISALSVIRKQPAAPTSNLIKDFGFGPRPSLYGKEAESDQPKSPAKHENPFLQFLSTSNKSPPAATSGTSSDSLSTNSVGFVFGENLSDRAKVSPVPATSGSSTSADEPSTSDGKDGGLSKSSSGATLRDQIVAELPSSVDIVTGEEGEKNVIQVSCRLYSFDRNTHQWVERGRGLLRLNDMASTADSAGVQSSRLVMRSSGSLRLMLNCKLWARMSCERASVKALRITVAQDPSNVEIFLVKANPRDIQQLYTALNHRLHTLRQAEKSTAKLDKPEDAESASSSSRDSPVSNNSDGGEQRQSDEEDNDQKEGSDSEDA